MKHILFIFIVGLMGAYTEVLVNVVKKETKNKVLSVNTNIFEKKVSI